MSYLVIARKYRPQVWNDVVAQNHVTDTLRNAVLHNRLAHAYLFTGPRGIGKTSAARILAKVLNCENLKDGSPCNECSNCREITEGRFIDVFEIDGASNRGIDEVRNLRDNIQYAPAHGKYKIYIIDEVHMLTSPAFNALLKTLEEPPDHVIFIFATTEPHKVPVTIISRCQRFDFRRIGINDIIDRLRFICKQENIEIEDGALHLIAKKADGSLRDGQSILDQLISFTQGKITKDEVIRGLGLIAQDMFFEVTEILQSKELSKGFTLVEKILYQGYDVDEFLIGLAEHLRNILVVKSVGSADLVEATGEDRERYLKIAGDFNEADLLRMINIVTEAKRIIRQSPNPQLVLEMTIARMVKMDSTVMVEDLLSRLGGTGRAEGGDKEVSDRKSKAGEESRTEDQKKNSIDIEYVQSMWDDVVKRVKHKKITVGSFLQEGVILGVDGNTIEIGFGINNGFHIDAINRAKSLVNDVLRECFGSSVNFRCVKKDLPKRDVSAAQNEKRVNRLEELIDKDPIVKKIVDDFDAEIVE